MTGVKTYSGYMVAFLIAGSAALLFSCKGGKHSERINPESVVTMKSEDLGMTVSRNGLKSYRFTTPLMEQYDLASDPYTKYPKGIYVETFQDSTEIVESTLRSNEAVYYQNRKLWMASGDVVATGSGNTLYTEQLFWDEKTDRVYSNVKVRVVDHDGEHLGEGFESDVNFETWVLKDYEGTLVLDTTPNEEFAEEGDAVGIPDPVTGNANSQETGQAHGQVEREGLSSGRDSMQDGVGNSSRILYGSGTISNGARGESSGRNNGIR